MYGLLSGSILSASVGVMFSIAFLPMTAGVMFTCFGISLASIIGMAFIDPSRVTLRTALFVLIGLTCGITIAPAVSMAAFMDPMILVQAGLGTLAIFAGCTTAALTFRRKVFLLIGGPLIGLLFVVILASLGTVLLPALGIGSPALIAALHNINLYLGLGVFSLFIAYDTQRMIESARSGIADPISDALSLFLNLLNIFIRLLEVFMASRK